MCVGRETTVTCGVRSIVFNIMCIIITAIKYLRKAKHRHDRDFLSDFFCFVFCVLFFYLENVDASPELLYWFSEQTLQPGPTVSLKCVATGNPPPQFTWTLDGFPVSVAECVWTTVREIIIIYRIDVLQCFTVSMFRTNWRKYTLCNNSFQINF